MGNSDQGEMLEVVLHAAERTIDAQRDELSGMRTRAVAFSALTITASAFLVGTGLDHGTKSTAFYVMATLATIAFCCLLFGLILVAIPMYKFRFILDPAELVVWIEGNNPVSSKQVMVRALVNNTYPEMVRANRKALGNIRLMYRIVLIAGACSVGIWTSIVWIFA